MRPPYPVSIIVKSADNLLKATREEPGFVVGSGGPPVVGFFAGVTGTAGLSAAAGAKETAGLAERRRSG